MSRNLIFALCNAVKVSGLSAPSCTVKNGKSDISKENAARIVPSRWILSFYLCIISLSWGTAQSGLPIQAPGINGFEVEESYRMQQSTFWVLPEGKSILDYTDQDKVFMREYELDARIAIGKNAEGSEFSITEILNPQEYFVPQTIPHKYVVVSDKDVRFYGLNGDFQWSELRPEADDEELNYDLPPMSDGGGSLPNFTDLPEGFEQTPHGYLYQDEVMRLEFNSSLGLVSTEHYGENGSWEFRMVEFLDTADPNRGVPLFQISVNRRVLPSEDCVFQVVTERYSEYFRKAVTGDHSGLAAKPMSSSGVVQASSDLAKIWPNPASDFLYVSTLGDPLETKRISLIALDGRMMVQSIVEGNQVIQLPLSGANAGIYLVKVESESQTQIEKVIIK